MATHKYIERAVTSERDSSTSGMRAGVSVAAGEVRSQGGGGSAREAGSSLELPLSCLGDVIRDGSAALPLLLPL